MEIVQIAELIGSAVVGGWVSRLLTIKSRVRQEGAQATKAESEAKKEQIEIIQKLVDDIYKPTIEDLKQDVRDLRVEVREVREENAKLKEENTQLHLRSLSLRTDHSYPCADWMRKPHALKEVGPERFHV